MSLRILVTRPPGRQASLVAALQASGHVAVSFPLLEIQPLDPGKEPAACEAVRDCLHNLHRYQHLVFISTHAVEQAFGWMEALAISWNGSWTWHAIGEATAKALEARTGYAINVAGPAMNSEALLATPALQQVGGQAVLIFRGVGGREHIAQVLGQRGALVDYCELYHRRTVGHPPGSLKTLMDAGMDALLLNSGESMQCLLEHAGNDGIKAGILRLPVIVPGQRLSRLAHEAGFAKVIMADNAGLPATLEAIQQL